MKRKSLDDLGTLQRAVMEIVWQLGEATVHQVRDGLNRRKEPAYTTILSVMQKLERFGWLKHRADGQSYIYRAACSRADASADSLRELIGRVFSGDHRLLFQQFLDGTELDEKELIELRKMIDRKRRAQRND